MLHLQNLEILLTTSIAAGTKYTGKGGCEAEKVCLFLFPPATDSDPIRRFETTKLTLDRGLQAFLGNIDDSQNVAGLVKDIKDATTGYQVCCWTSYDSVSP
jgi:hypothetical protein